jgi:uncharacterized OsmC-like protein
MAEVCCTIDYAKIRRNMERWRRAIQTGKFPPELLSVTKDGKPGTIWPVVAVARKVDESVEEATFPLLKGHHVIRTDEVAEPVYYGKASAPQPLEIFLAGIGMCMTSIYGEGAADLGMTIDSVEVRVQGDCDMTGILDLNKKGYENRPGFAKIHYKVKIESKEPKQRVRELIDRVERACPAHNTVSRGAPSEFTYELNGKPLTKVSPSH